MLARDAAIAVLDFESTGAVGAHPNEPWQIGVILVRSGRVDRDSAFSRFLHVGDRPFNPHAPGRHAQLRDRLATAPRLEHLWADLNPRLSGRPLAAHNAGTEKTFLKRAFPLHALGPWIDTLKLVRLAYPRLRSHKLEAVVDTLNLQERVRELTPDREPHDALYDACACAVVLEHLLSQPAGGEVSVTALTRARPIRYHRERLRSTTSSGGTTSPG